MPDGEGRLDQRGCRLADASGVIAEIIKPRRQAAIITRKSDGQQDELPVGEFDTRHASGPHIRTGISAGSHHLQPGWLALCSFRTVRTTGILNSGHSRGIG
jgi:hypothetical protein